MNRGDELVAFAGEGPAPEPAGEPWKVLVVDDEEIVHSVTAMVLRDLNYRGRPLRFLSARSAAEAQELCRTHPDIAVALIDVVMESDDAGLELVRWIREEVGNRFMRLVLRTGQPGHAPEQEIIQRYEINDYKEKTELTNTRLATTITVALRGYEDILALEHGRRGLKKIIDATGTFLGPHSVQEFTEGVITHLGGLVADSDQSVEEVDGLSVQPGPDNELTVVAGTGRYGQSAGRRLMAVDDPVVRDLVLRSWDQGGSVVQDAHFCTFLPARRGPHSVLYVRLPQKATDRDRSLLEVYRGSAALAFDNLSMALRMDHAQRETIFLLSELVEKRSQSTGNHVRRVGRIVEMIALLAGADAEEAELWHLGASLHDVGKIAIPDHILNKPGTLTDVEFQAMQQHTVFGHELLSRHPDELMQVSAQVARWHHEMWNGEGYPDGLSEEQIPLPARANAIADVFDALTHTRPYKHAWSVEEAHQYVLSRSGVQFDPALTPFFAGIRGELESLLLEFPD